jgi:Flp pilus assembly protein TadG
VTRRRRGDGGQATVELALVLPLVVVLLFAVVQVGLLVRDEVMVVHAAREAARQAAVEPDIGKAKAAAASSTGLSASGLDVSVQGRDGPGSHVRVTVRYHPGSGLPVVGRLVSRVTLSATATMRVET